MLLILGSVLGALIGVALIVFLDDDFFGVMTTFVCGLCLLFSLIAIPMARMDYYNDVAEYKAIKSTIAVIRKEKKHVELTAVILEMVNINAAIASARYWDGWWIGIYIPDEYVELEYLK